MRVDTTALIALIALAGCGQVTPRTQVMLEVDAEDAIAARADAIRIEVASIDDPRNRLEQTFLLSDEGVELPIRVALVPQGGDPTRLFRVAAFARDGVTDFAVARARSGYVAEKTIRLRIVLYDACEGVMCADDETCADDGECDEEPNVDPCTLETLEGERGCAATDAAMDAATDADASEDARPDGAPDAGDTGTAATWTKVACGEFNTCAVASDGRVFCWGLNTFGQSSGLAQPAPITPTGAVEAVHVTAGGQTSCATDGMGATSCWGGQFPGDGTSSSYPRDPVRVRPDMTALSSGSDHLCGISAGQVACWGMNDTGQIPGSTGSETTPTLIDPQPSPPVAVSAGTGFTCTVGRGKAGANVECWGRNDYGQVEITSVPFLTPLAIDLTPLGPITSLSCGARHSCATDGVRVMCWGDNAAGAVAPGGAAGRTPPTQVDLSGPGTPTEVAAGNAFSCALLTTGDVACWGSDSDGQRGEGPAPADPAPTLVALPGATTIVQVSAGYSHACAVSSDGRLWCWGRNDHVQLGASVGAESAVPVAVPAPPPPP